MENEYLSNHSIYLFHSVNSVCFQFTKALTTYRFRALSVAAMLPLSGTSSFFNDTVRFTGFLFTMAIAFVSISQTFFGGTNI